MIALTFVIALQRILIAVQVHFQSDAADGDTTTDLATETIRLAPGGQRPIGLASSRGGLLERHCFTWIVWGENLPIGAHGLCVGLCVVRHCRTKPLNCLAL